MKPHALVCNDDGIESGFLIHLVRALLPDFRVTVAAPQSEQSWIGRAISRRGEVEVVSRTDIFPAEVQAWAVDGTPTDCVNIALGHLLEAGADIVISGINIGYNTTETLILSSGTVAGATEGAMWGLPAVAFSKCVPEGLFADIQRAKGHADGNFAESLAAAAKRSSAIALDILNKPLPKGQIFNVNYPVDTTMETPIEDTFPAKIHLGSFYVESSPGKYVFRYSEGRILEPHPNTDRSALDRGVISRSVLDFSRMGQRS